MVEQLSDVRIRRQVAYDYQYIETSCHIDVWSVEERDTVRFQGFWRDVAERYQRYAAALAIPDG